MLKKIIWALTISFVLQVTVGNMNIHIGNQIVYAASTPVDLSKSHWAYSSIQNMLDKQYMQVYEDGTFKSSKPITRAEAASAIAKSLGISLETKLKPNFKDVDKTHPNYNEITKLVELKILQNCDYFRPNAPLTRAQLMKMLSLAYHIEIDSQNKSRFTDVPRTYWARDYIESLADIGIVKGVGNNRFSPNQVVSRCQAAALIDRSLNFKKKIENREVAYDFLSKDYIPTVNLSWSWSKETIRLINIEREKQQLTPLTMDVALTQIATIKAQDMVKRGYFEHISPYYGAPWDLASLFDYPYTSFGENIARRIPSPEAAVKAWMASPKHRENILRPHYTNTGVAIQKDSKGYLYWVQMFSSQ